MDWQVCPRCKSSKYRNPALVLMVNVCGHVLCEACVEQLFVRGSGACPQCQKPLKRSQFRAQFFEDAEMDKEVGIRKKIMSELNLRQEDFQSLRDFNDYLEQIETFIFNLVSEIDLDETNRNIAAFKEKYKKELQKNRFKKSKEQELLEQIIQQERLLETESDQKAADFEREEAIRRARNKDQLLDELQDSEMSAEAVLAVHKRKTGSLDVEEHHIPLAIPRQIIEDAPPIISAVEAEWFLLADEVLFSVEGNMEGPPVPSFEDLELGGYLRNVRSSQPIDLAMGFPSTIPARLALLSAFDGIYTFHT